MGYEFNSQDVKEFAHSFSGEIKEKGDELFFRYCPYCDGGGHNDKETFSINLTNGTFHCFRSSCHKQGHFVELARDFQYPLDFQEEAKQYRKLPQRKIITTDTAVIYLNRRGIQTEIIKQYSITCQNQNQDILVFPFFDENNVLVSVKYRNSKFRKGIDKNKEWFEKDTKPILFGMNHCVDFKTLVITEGQIDSLTLASCGIPNAVSVPTGANGFTWLTNCWDWVAKFEEVIVFGDLENTL